MATSGHGIKILNSVSKAHPKSYIIKSYRRTLTLGRLHGEKNDANDNNQNKNFPFAQNRKQLSNKSPDNIIKEPTREGKYLSDLLEKSFDLLVRNRCINNVRRNSYSLQADFENNTQFLPSFDLVICDRSRISSASEDRRETDGFTFGRKDSHSSRRSISCEVLQIPEETNEQDLNYLKDDNRCQLSFSKSTSNIPDNFLSEESHRTLNKPDCNYDNFTVLKDQLSNRTFESVKSKSNVNVSAAIDGKGSNNLLEKPLKVGLYAAVKSKVNPQISCQIRQYSVQKNTDDNNDELATDRSERYSEYGAPYSGQKQQSLSDKWMNSSRSLLRHIKRHVQEKHKNISPGQKSGSGFQPSIPERRRAPSDSARPAATDNKNSPVDEIKPLLLVISNAKQMAFEMKRLVKQQRDAEYLLKESDKQSTVVSNQMKTQRNMDHDANESSSYGRSAAKTYPEHCNKLEPTDKPPVTYYSRYSHLNKRAKNDESSDLATPKVSQAKPSKNPAQTKSQQINEIKNRKPVVMRGGGGYEHPTFVKLIQNKELKSNLSDSIFERTKKKVIERQNYISTYEFPHKNIDENEVESKNKNPDGFSKVHTTVSREINLWRKKHFSSNEASEKNDDEDKMSSTKKEEQDQKKIVTFYTRNKDKEYYPNSLTKSKRSNTKPYEKKENRITPEFLLNAKIKKRDAVKSASVDDAYVKKALAMRKMNRFSSLAAEYSNPLLNKRTKYNKNFFSSYFKDRSDFDLNNVLVDESGTNNETVDTLDDRAQISVSNSLPERKPSESKQPNELKTKKSNAVEQFLNRDGEMDIENLKAPSSVEKFSLKKLTSEKSFPFNLRHQFGKEFDKNEGLLRDISLHDTARENSKSQQEVVNSTFKRPSPKESGSIFQLSKGIGGRKRNYLKDNFNNFFKTHFQYFSARDGKQQSSGSRTALELPKSKSIHNFTTSSSRDSDQGLKKDSERRKKFLETYEEYVENSKVMKKHRTHTAKNKNQQYLETMFYDEERLNPKAYKNKGFMNYFMDEFKRKSGLTDKKTYNNVGQTELKRLSFNEPINKLQPSELTIKLKNFSSVPEIRNDAVVNHFSSRINKGKSKYRPDERIADENIPEFSIKQHNLLHNNMLTPSFTKMPAVKETVAILNNETTNNMWHKSLSNLRSFKLKENLTESINKDVKWIFNTDSFNRGSQGGLYSSPINENEEKNETDFQKAVSAEAVVSDETKSPHPTDKESIRKKLYENHATTANRYNKYATYPHRYQFDVPKLSSDEFDANHVSSNHWLDEMNNTRALISIPMNVKGNKFGPKFR